MSFKRKEFPLEFSDRIRRINIRHEALLMQNLERINKERRIQLNRIEMAIKSAERNAKVTQDGIVEWKYDKRRSWTTEDEFKPVSLIDERMPTFLDRQVEGYRKSLTLMKDREHRQLPLDKAMLTIDKPAEPRFDAFFPPLQQRQSNLVAGSKDRKSRDLPGIGNSYSQ